MLVLSMDSKRQRRPNVRLGEIGDMPAAFACVFSQKSKDDLGYGKWKLDIGDPEENEKDISEFSKEKTPDCLESSEHVSPRISGDLQRNRENKDPNSPRSAFEFTNSDEIQMGLMIQANLDFGTVTRKSRAMKRRARGRQGTNNVFSGTWSWNSRVSPKYNSEDGSANSEKKLTGSARDACSDHIIVNEFKDCTDNEAPATSKVACEFDMDEHGRSSWLQRDFDDYWEDDVCRGVNNICAKSSDDCELDQMQDVGADADSVKEWLEDLGFGIYAGVFEMHEVDKETLPLLTLEDLKDMGIIAVGHRRKLYTAIQQLRGDVST